MTPEQLRHLRGTRTRAALAEELGISASAIVHWEGGVRAIPNWVADKMLQTVSVELPLADLAELVTYAQSNGVEFSKLLGSAIRDYIQNHRAEGDDAQTPPDMYRPELPPIDTPHAHDARRSANGKGAA